MAAIAGNFVAGDTIYVDAGDAKLSFSKKPFAKQQVATEVDPEAAAAAKAALAEKAKAEAKQKAEAKKPARKRSRRGSSKPTTPANDSGTDTPEANVAELKKATQDLLDATEEAKKKKK